MSKPIDVEDLILNYDPVQPQQRFIDAGIKAATFGRAARLPVAVPWPAGRKPVAVPLAPAPAPHDDLTRFKGYDAIVITWTSAEAAALAALFTPEYPPQRWYLYRHNVEAYIPLVTGHRAPFRMNTDEMKRYYHTLGLYFPCKIGSARVLLFKSGLHLDYDGPQTPLARLTKELLDAVDPKVLITTGTGGGIGREVQLGDVVVAGMTRFDCTTQFKDRPWAKDSYKTSPLPKGFEIPAALLKVNASKVPNGRATPKVWKAKGDAIVTTDFFGFDETTNHYKLQGLGRACDMGDAMIGQVLTRYPKIAWYAIRNASDPQIKTVNGDIRAAEQEAGRIYSRYGVFTTAASVVASWGVIDSTFKKKVVAPVPQSRPHGFKFGKKPAVADSRNLRFATYARVTIPALPAKIDWGQKVRQWPMYSNDVYGDCTCAAAAHMIQAWTASVGPEKKVSEKAVLTFYEHFTTPGPDNGCDMLDVLNWWRKHGLSRDKIAAYTQVDQDNVTHTKQAIWLFGGCYIGVCLPHFVANATDPLAPEWKVPAGGPHGNAAPDRSAGHCISAVGYDAHNVYVVTWGVVKPMSWDFYLAYADECYAVLSRDFFRKSDDQSAGGFDFDLLQRDLVAVTDRTGRRGTVGTLDRRSSDAPRQTPARLHRSRT